MSLTPLQPAGRCCSAVVPGAWPWYRLTALVLCLLAGCATARQEAAARAREAERLAEQARSAQDRGDAATAEVLMAAAVKNNPTNCEARLELSNLLVQTGSLDAAAEHLQRLIDQNPEDPRGHLRLAQVEYHRNDYYAAEHALNTALKLDPQHTEALLLRGKLLEVRKNDELALENYHRAILTDPQNVETQIRIAALHVKHGRPRQAAPLLRSVIDNTNACPAEHAEASWLLGEAYAQDGRWAEAAMALQSGMKGRELTSDQWYQLAYARRAVGDFRGALAATEEALKLSPQDTTCLALQTELRQAAPNALAGQGASGGTAIPVDLRVPQPSGTSPSGTTTSARPIQSRPLQ